MNISLNTSLTSASLGQALQTTQPTSTSGSDSSPVHAHKHHHGGGGRIQQATDQALKSIGLSVPSATDPSASAASSASSSSSDSSTSGVQGDLQAFMHQLFEAVKGQPATGSSDPSSSAAKTSFSDGLSSLISQVSNGTAPAGLQDAFSKLASDVQSSSATAATSTSTDSTAAAPTLAAFLTTLQQDLGYGSNATSSGGNLVTAQV